MINVTDVNNAKIASNARIVLNAFVKNATINVESASLVSHACPVSRTQMIRSVQNAKNVSLASRAHPVHHVGSSFFKVQSIS